MSTDKKKQRGLDKRAKVTITNEECTTLMKLHVVDPTVDDKCMTDNTDQIIVRYSVLLQALFAVTSRLNAYVLKRAFMALFEGTWDFADMWANKVLVAFKQLMSTGRAMSDGSRLPPEVVSAAVPFKRRLSPTPSPSPPRLRVKVEKERSSG